MTLLRGNSVLSSVDTSWAFALPQPPSHHHSIHSRYPHTPHTPSHTRPRTDTCGTLDWCHCVWAEERATDISIRHHHCRMSPVTTATSISTSREGTPYNSRHIDLWPLQVLVYMREMVEVLQCSQLMASVCVCLFPSLLPCLLACDVCAQGTEPRGIRRQGMSHCNYITMSPCNYVTGLCSYVIVSLYYNWLYMYPLQWWARCVRCFSHVTLYTPLDW